MRARLIAAIQRRASNLRSASLLIRSFLIVVAGGVATFAQFMDWPSAGPSNSQITGIIASIVATIGGLASVILDKDSSEELSLAHAAIAEAEALEAKAKIAMYRFDAVDDYETEIEQLIELYQAARVMRNIVEVAATAIAGDESKIAADFMTLAGRSLAIAAGFQLTDRWTICIYRAVSIVGQPDVVLKCVAHKRAIECTLDEARTWPVGKGVAGMSYMTGQPVIVSNMQAPELQPMIRASDESRPGDGDRYRSMAAFPIVVPGQDMPWGVATATNDRYDHFNYEDEDGLKTEEAIRLLAEFMSLAITVFDQRQRAASVPAIPQ